jgi:rhodanese-related sulfurtransferase
MLQNAGWEKARSLAEGIDEWAERGLPLQRWEQS